MYLNHRTTFIWSWSLSLVVSSSTKSWRAGAFRRPTRHPSCGKFSRRSSTSTSAPLCIETSNQRTCSAARTTPRLRPRSASLTLGSAKLLATKQHSRQRVAARHTSPPRCCRNTTMATRTRWISGLRASSCTYFSAASLRSTARPPRSSLSRSKAGTLTSRRRIGTTSQRAPRSSSSCSWWSIPSSGSPPRRLWLTRGSPQRLTSRSTALSSACRR
eukprot:Amastigsp_a412_279.p2 type:complete len:216 gc:universal Amastigsp_a412_279:837-190(-)